MPNHLSVSGPLCVFCLFLALQSVTLLPPHHTADTPNSPTGVKLLLPQLHLPTGAPRKHIQPLIPAGATPVIRVTYLPDSNLDPISSCSWGRSQASLSPGTLTMQQRSLVGRLSSQYSRGLVHLRRQSRALTNSSRHAASLATAAAAGAAGSGVGRAGAAVVVASAAGAAAGGVPDFGRCVWCVVCGCYLTGGQCMHRASGMHWCCACMTDS